MDMEEHLTSAIHVRLRDDSLRALRAIARAEHRSVAAQARRYIEQALAAADNPQSVDALVA